MENKRDRWWLSEIDVRCLLSGQEEVLQTYRGISLLYQKDGSRFKVCVQIFSEELYGTLTLGWDTALLKAVWMVSLNFLLNMFCLQSTMQNC